MNFIGANATRCSLVFAILILIQGFFVADAACDAVLSSLGDFSCTRQLPATSSGSITQSEYGHTTTDDQVPAVKHNHRICDLFAMNRRSSGEGNTGSNVTQANLIVDYLTPVFKTTMVSHRSGDEIFPADDSEFLRTSMLETRGKPSVR